MPVVSGFLTAEGAVAGLVVGPPERVYAAAKAAGQTPPLARVQVLLDSGASHTVVDRTVRLQVPQVRGLLPRVGP